MACRDLGFTSLSLLLQKSLEIFCDYRYSI